MKSIEIADGGILIVIEDFLPQVIANHYFTELQETCAWEQKPGVFGHMQPRLTASYGDAGVTYRYSRTVNVALNWTNPDYSQFSKQNGLLCRRKA